MTVADRHLDADQLSAAVDGDQEPPVARHLEHCPACREQLATWRHALDRLEPPEAASPVEVDRVVRRALASAAPRPRRRPPRALLGAAAVVVACVLVGVGVAQLHTGGSSMSSSSSGVTSPSHVGPRHSTGSASGRAGAPVPSPSDGAPVAGATGGAPAGAPASGSAGSASASGSGRIVAVTPEDLARQLRAIYGDSVESTSAAPPVGRCRAAAGVEAMAAGYRGGPIAETGALLAGRAVDVWVYRQGAGRLAVVVAWVGCGPVARLSI